jgi:LysM repeat protein
MKRIKLSNSVFLTALIVILPIYPVFGSVLYDGSYRGDFAGDIDRSTIIDAEDDIDYAPTASLSSPSISEWTGRKVIEYYTIQEGDTLESLAAHFHLTQNSLRWANTLTSNILRVGQELIIPPWDGVIYTVKNGDTLSAIAQKYKLTSEKIQITNTIGDDIRAGQLLFLPDARPPVIIPDVVRTAVTGKYELRVVNPKWAGFVPGHCTYFVAKHWPVTWRGNARNWFKNAKAAGFQTGQTAKPGAIVVWYGPGYNLTYGHVGIVISVDAKRGTMIVKDMNYAGLWKITTREEKIKNKYIIGFIYHP